MVLISSAFSYSFQSTQPSQAVTISPTVLNRIVEFQSTQPSQAVTLFHFRSHADCRISIHTALAGCDVEVLAVAFNMEISIHTALAGCEKNFSAQSEGS